MVNDLTVAFAFIAEVGACGKIKSGERSGCAQYSSDSFSGHAETSVIQLSFDASLDFLFAAVFFLIIPFEAA